LPPHDEANGDGDQSAEGVTRPEARALQERDRNVLVGSATG
jgi:hypothetical protein